MSDIETDAQPPVDPIPGSADHIVFQMRAAIDESPGVLEEEHSAFYVQNRDHNRRVAQLRRMRPWVVRGLIVMIVVVLIAEFVYVDSFLGGIHFEDVALPINLAAEQLGADLPAAPVAPPFP